MLQIEGDFLALWRRTFVAGLLKIMIALL